MQLYLTMLGLHRAPEHVCSESMCRSVCGILASEVFCMTAAVLLEAVAEDIREYLRSRRDTIRCIVTMLTDDSAGGSGEGGPEGESLFEELKRTVADEVCLSCLCT